MEFQFTDEQQMILDYGSKLAQSFDHAEWLKEMADKYMLEDESKALRIVLDYVMQEADHDEVFEEMRCHHCG